MLAICCSLTIGAVSWQVLRHSGSLYDDAYIYFRFAKNLLSGCGFRYNCSGSPVEGFTSPLYLLLLALGGLIGADFSTVAMGLCSLTLVASIIVAAGFALTRQFAGWLPWASGLAALTTTAALALDPFFLLNAVVGLETPLAAGIISGLFVAMALGREIAIGVLLVLAVLSRPEAILFVPAAVFVVPLTRRRFWLWLGLALVALLVLRLAIFGDIVPNTYRAKSGGTWRHAELGMAYIVEVFRDFPLLVLAPLSLWVPELRRHALPFLCVTFCWVLFFFYTGGDHFHYSRLAAPLVPVLTMLACLGAVEIAGRLARFTRARATGAITLALLGAGPTLGHLARVLVTRQMQPSHGFAEVQRWASVGRYLARYFPGQTFATVPVGAMAYESGADVIDLVGIVTAEVAWSGGSVPNGLLIRNWLGHERHDTAWVLSQKPAVVVIGTFRNSPWREMAETRAGFYAAWELLQQAKAAEIPYRLYDAPVAKGEHWLFLLREGVRPAE